MLMLKSSLLFGFPVHSSTPLLQEFRVLETEKLYSSP